MKAQADLHQRIAKAHQNAAKCLDKGNKPQSECSNQLIQECQSTGASPQCMPQEQQQQQGGQQPEQEQKQQPY